MESPKLLRKRVLIFSKRLNTYSIIGWKFGDISIRIYFYCQFTFLVLFAS